MSDAMWGAAAIVLAAAIATIPAWLAARRGNVDRKRILGQVETGNGRTIAGYVMHTEHLVSELAGHVLDVKRHVETLEDRIDRLEAPDVRPPLVD